MFNEAQLSVTGYVASEPQFRRVGVGGVPKLTMRVAWTTRRIDSATGAWVDGNTSFVWVTCWRRLAENLATCLRKGEPVMLRGRLDVRPFTGKDGIRRISVDVDASYLGYDLTRGVAAFKRVWETTGKTAEEAAATGNGALGDSAGDPAGDPAGRFADGDPAGRFADGEAPAPAAAGGPVPVDGSADGSAADLGSGGADEEIFDDGAIDALAQDSASVATPS
jgi:single-strand DNA-binding protein